MPSRVSRWRPARGGRRSSQPCSGTDAPSYVQSVNLAVTDPGWISSISSSRADAFEAGSPGRSRLWLRQEFPTEAEVEEMATAVEVARAHLVGAAAATAHLGRLHPATAAVADLATAIRIATRGLDGIRETWS